MFRCQKAHEHGSEAEREQCDALHYDALSLMKMAQVGFAGPAKIARTYRPARSEERTGLCVFVFCEEQIIPWHFDDDADEDD